MISTHRCNWTDTDPLMIQYHDEEWGVPVYDDRKFFEFMVLDAFQAGLSWRTVLHKRENFRKAFDNFDFNIIADYNDEKVNELLNDKGIIRNKLKINAAIHNAQVFLDVIKTEGSFVKYIWEFVGNKTIINHWTKLSEIPATSKESDAMSKALKKRGFKFVGSTICYSFMQAAGMVNDHVEHCFRKYHKDLDHNLNALH